MVSDGLDDTSHLGGSSLHRHQGVDRLRLTSPIGALSREGTAGAMSPVSQAVPPTSTPRRFCCSRSHRWGSISCRAGRSRLARLRTVWNSGPARACFYPAPALAADRSGCSIPARSSGSLLPVGPLRLDVYVLQQWIVDLTGSTSRPRDRGHRPGSEWSGRRDERQALPCRHTRSALRSGAEGRWAQVR